MSGSVLREEAGEVPVITLGPGSPNSPWMGIRLASEAKVNARTAILLVAPWFAACGANVILEEEAVRDRDGYVCPTCLPGGDERTVGAVSSSCEDEVAQLVNSDIAQEFELESLVAFDGVSNEQTFGWYRADYRPALRATFDSGATLTYELVLGEPKYVTSSECVPYITVPVTGTFETSDGALAFEAKGRALRSRGGPWAISTRTDLADVHGNSVLVLDDGETALLGRFDVDMSLTPKGLRGDLSYSVAHFRDRESAERFVESSQTRDIPEGLVTMKGDEVAAFPFDACPRYQEPVAAEERYPFETGKSFADSLVEAMANFPSGTRPAFWLDGTETALSVELGVPPTSAVCAGVWNDESEIWFEVEAELQSTDGRVDLRLPPTAYGVLHRSLDTNRLQSMRISFHGARLPPVEFEREFGLGVNAPSDDELTLSARISFNWKADADMPESSGFLSVEPWSSAEALECLYWPAGAAPPICRPTP
jgi:hypothetical protein